MKYRQGGWKNCGYIRNLKIYAEQPIDKLYESKTRKNMGEDTPSVAIYVQLPKKAVYGIFIRLFKKHSVQVLRNQIYSM